MRILSGAGSDSIFDVVQWISYQGPDIKGFWVGGFGLDPKVGLG